MTRNVLLGASVAAFAFASPAFAQTADQSPGSGHTVILSPVTFIKDVDLNFGAVVLPTGVAGSVEIDPDPANVSFVTNTGVLPIPASSPTRGKMVGAGSAGSDVTVETAFPTDLYLNGDTTSSVTLPVSLNVNATEVAANTYTYTIDSGQAFEVYVGGRVNIPAGTADGSYSNVYTITATYP